MIKYGESYITSICTIGATAKNTAKVTNFDITSTAKLRTLSHIVSKLKELDATNLSLTASLFSFVIKFREIRKAEANLTSYTNIDTIIVKPPKDGPADLESEAQFKLSEYYAQIWRIKDMQTPYIEGHTIRYELTDGYVFNQDMECYSKPQTLFTFNVPFVAGATFNTNINQNAIMTRVRFFESDLDSQITLFARGNYNYGRFASLLFPYAIQDDIPGRRIRYYYVDLDSSVSIIAVPYNFTKAQAYLDSLFALSYPITYVNRKFTSDLSTLVNQITNNSRVRFIPSSLLSTITHENLDDTRLRRTLVTFNSLTSIDTGNISRSTRKFSANLQTTTNANIVGDFGGFTLEIDVTSTTNPVVLYIGGSGNRFIDWGDGSTTTTSSNTPSKTYATTGTKIVSIKNATSFNGINVFDASSISSFKLTNWGSKYDAVKNPNANITQFLPGYDIDSPNNHLCVGVPNYLPTRDNTNTNQRLTLISLAGSRDTGSMTFNDSNITSWDLTKLPIVGTHVTQPVLRKVFQGCTSFNQNISSWNTANITDMSYWFTRTLFDQPIGVWNTANVTDMSFMFGSNNTAVPFNKPIGSWNTAKVTNMNSMFKNASSFDQPILTSVNNWNTSLVTDMSSMFYGASAFNQSIGNWNTANVTTMNSMFRDATSFNLTLSTWNTAKVTNMASMFQNATAFNRPISRSVNNWNTGLVTNMTDMFNGATGFDQNISNWCVSLIATKPTGFDTNTNVNWTTAEKPVWGTCP